MDTQAVHQLAELLAAPNALASAGVPELLQYSSSHHLEGTFFDMAGTEAFGNARVGTRPGHPFADLIFNFALGLIMQKVGAALQAEGWRSFASRRWFIRVLDHIVVDMGPRKDLRVHVTHMYKHLGGQVCSNSDMREEIAFHAGTSHSVERSLRTNMFANPRLPLKMRLMFLN